MIATRVTETYMGPAAVKAGMERPQQRSVAQVQRESKVQYSIWLPAP